MSSALTMMASCGCSLITSSEGTTYFPSTFAVSKSKGTEKPWRKRTFTTKSPGLRPQGSSRLLQHKRASVQLSQTFVPKKAAVASQASSARVSGSHQSVASKDKKDRNPERSRSEGKSQKQEANTSTSPADFAGSRTSPATRQMVVKDGFAGLSALKAQLEQQRPRTSRVKVNDVGGELLPRHKQRAELRKRQEAVKSSTSPTSDVMSRGTSSPSELPSSDRPIRNGDTTTLIRVTNLAKQVTEEEYRLVMQSIPEVTSWNYLSDRGGEQCLGYGFCEVQAAKSGIAAIIEHLSEHVLHGKKIKASLAERSGEYNKLSLERQQVRLAATSIAAAGKEVPSSFSSSSSISSSSSSSSNSVKRELSKGKPRATKQGGGLRDVWKVQSSSLETDATDLGNTKDSSSKKFTTPDGGKLEDNLKNQTTDMEAVQNLIPVMEQNAAEMGSSSTSVHSWQGPDSQSTTKLSGKSVMEAMQRAAALRDSKVKSKRKGRSGGGKYSSDSDSDDDSKQYTLPPLVFKPEWASKIEQLENDLKQLTLLS